MKHEPAVEPPGRCRLTVSVCPAVCACLAAAMSLSSSIESPPCEQQSAVRLHFIYGHTVAHIYCCTDKFVMTIGTLACCQHFTLLCYVVQHNERRKKEVEQMRASLDEMRATNQERQQQQRSAEATLTALQVLCCLPMLEHREMTLLLPSEWLHSHLAASGINSRACMLLQNTGMFCHCI